jgi:putative restriction endonuclease
MRFWVGVTDKSWFTFLAARKPDEVNFWRPSPTGTFRAIDPGSPFLFKLHAPENSVVGGGFFLTYEELPLWLAWDAFGEKNGAPDLNTLSADILRHRDEPSANPVIGCIVLGDPFFFAPELWIPIPSDWRSHIRRGKTYDTTTSVGKSLWSAVTERLMAQGTRLSTDLFKGPAVSDETRFKTAYLTTARIGQGAFRVFVTSAYERRCAISGERVLPVLQAAHIKPYAKTGPNRVCNGLLLRSDIHTLFDRGYLTVTPELRVEVSPKIRDEFDNGEEYY